MSIAQIKGSALNEGHRRSLRMLQDVPAVLDTLALYRELVTPAGVYLRPSAGGLTVISLDPECGSMIGVGARDSAECYLKAIPPTRSQVERAAAGYRAKLASLNRVSAEERFALSCIRGALEDRLILRHDSLIFVSQEWRLGGGKIDLLALEPKTGRLVVIELKRSQSEARAAAKQTQRYVDALFQNRVELYPFFRAIASASAAVCGASKMLAQLPDAQEQIPDIRFWTP